MTYDVDYFIKKFEAIPENKWQSVGQLCFDGKKCALGHIGVTLKDIQANGNILHKEGKALAELFRLLVRIENNYLGDYERIYLVNDSLTATNYQQPTPKQRILAALYDIKKLQEPKVKEVIRYVAVDADIRKETKELELVEN